MKYDIELEVDGEITKKFGLELPQIRGMVSGLVLHWDLVEIDGLRNMLSDGVFAKITEVEEEDDEDFLAELERNHRYDR